MKTLKLGLYTFAILATHASLASAAWNNVFQATLYPKNPSPPVVAPVSRVVVAQPVSRVVEGQLVCASCQGGGAYYSNNCCPQQCTTKYVQRTYYEPVTTYTTKTYYEAVTTYQTSYYYEPCTTYRYSCYFDPCTCSYQQVACPTTSYQLRSQCCPVTSYVQRCCTEPCTTYRQACYYEPVTSCCQPTCQPCCAPAAATPAPAAQAAPTYSPPAIVEQRSANPPGVTEQRSFSPPVTDAPPPATYMPESYKGQQNNRPYDNRSYYPNTSNKQPVQNWKPATPAPALRNNPPAPPVKLDRIVVGPNSRIEGRVVRSDNTPRSNAVLTFVSTSGAVGAQKTTANSAGRFQVTLPSGGWLVYLNAPNGTRIYHSRIEVDSNRPPLVTLVSRSE